MAEDEDPQIGAVLAKLAGKDAAAGEDARAALEWIAGDQGLDLITQQRIQNFCWYDLPVKWLVDLGDKLRIVAALAQALDLLQLSRYAAICRSGTTREVLGAYEAGIAHGKAAFRRAAAASGVVPPDLPDFQWGAAMGFEEASAWSSTAEFLEVAVASGDLVPGRRGWKARQQELVRAHLNVSQAGLLGQTLAQVILTERAGTWLSSRRSETRRQILAPVANRLLHPAELSAATAADPLPPLRWLLEQLDGGIALTQTGNLNRKFVQQNADRFGWDFSGPPSTEDELYDLHQLRHFAQRYRLGPAPANAFLQDWSGDGTHALFLDPNLSPSSASVIVLDLQTGRASSFAVNTATSSVTASFSRSAGTAILVLASAAGGGFLPLQRFSLTGAQEICYPAGAVAGAYGNYQENANGTAIVFSTQYGIEVVSSSGQLVRALATQYGPGACQLLNWWNDQSVLAACSGGLLAFPLSGGPPERLTTSRDRGSFLGAWRLPSGTYAEDGACGSTWLERLNPDGTATRLTVPGTPDGGRVQPLGADGDQLPVQVSGGCAPSPSSFVEWYNPADGVARPVLGGPAGGGYVTDSILFPAG